MPSPTRTASAAAMSSEKEKEGLSEECKQLLQSLPTERGWRTPHLYFFQSFWCQPKQIQAIISAQRHFHAHHTDIILASIPKSGTTWLKALAFATLNRRQIPVHSQTHPLLTSNSHALVPFFEYDLYTDARVPDLSGLTPPRLFSTHVPYSALPPSVKSSGCRIVYLCRNPLDTFVSIWHFLSKARPEDLGPLPIEEAFEMYCRGVVGFGPNWDHLLGYWKESIERPNTVMFLKYEDLKEDIVGHLRRLAEFLGQPFTAQEERDGVVEAVARLCSFETMKELEVNKTGKFGEEFKNEDLFRRGEVGGWVNYLSGSMVEEVSGVMEEKLGGSGLEFKLV